MKPGSPGRLLLTLIAALAGCNSGDKAATSPPSSEPRRFEMMGDSMLPTYLGPELGYKVKLG